MIEHGGKRSGAGRKPSGRTERRGPFMLSPEAANWLDEQANKSKAINDLIKERMMEDVISWDTQEALDKTFGLPKAGRVG